MYKEKLKLALVNQLGPLIILRQQWGPQMTSKSTKTKPTTTTTTKSATILSITTTSTTMARSATITILNTKFSRANYDYITINRP